MTDRPEVPSPSRLPRWGGLAAALALSLGAVLFAFNPVPHDGGDNATYVTLAYSLLRFGTYTELFDPARPPHTTYPPVFPALLALMIALGARTWTALKAVAVVSTVAASGLTYLWAERSLGVRWALGVAGALALAPAAVYYGHWEISDTTFLAFVVLALLALERAGRAGGPLDRRWLAVGVAAVGLAYFTRTAGLPLVLALLAWLALERRWRALTVSGIALGLPAVLWAARSRLAGTGVYANAFWLRDPYDWSKGTLGAAELAQRAGRNVVYYGGTIVPEGLSGATGPVAVAIGILVLGLALAGWAGTLRRRVGPTEIFFPCYAGLLLLWPEVWSGDRFALPLFPILLLYAARTVKRVGGAGGVSPLWAGAALLALLVLPSLRSLVLLRQEAARCATLSVRESAFACYGPGKASFMKAAEWARTNLPEGSAVLTRKPSLFYAMSGIPSRAFPFVEDPAAHLRAAREAGARYALYDRWDGLSVGYVLEAVRARPDAFCAVHGFASDGTTLLGILPEAARHEANAREDGARMLVRSCPAGFAATATPVATPHAPTAIPLLEGLDR